MFNKNQIKIINHLIADWRRKLSSANSEDEKREIENIIKEYERELENDRRNRNQNG